MMRAHTPADPHHHPAYRCAAHLSRRAFMAGAAAFGAAAALPVGARGEAARLIDTHHHFYAPAYQKAWLDFDEAHKITPFPS
jgi:6-methylsalicylate decarboxylase